jgi:hypothetical protein
MFLSSFEDGGGNDGIMTVSNCFVGANTATRAGGGISDDKGRHLTIQARSKGTSNTAETGADFDVSAW